MAKKIFTSLALSLAFMFVPAFSMEASARIEVNEIDASSPKIDFSDNIAIISGAAGKTLRIYNLVGSQVKTISIDSAEKRIDLSQLSPSVYIIKVGGVSKRIQIK